MRALCKLAEHVPDMLRYRRLAREADVVHFQWLSVQHLDAQLLPARRSPSGARRPLVLTAHDVLPREPRPGSSPRSGGCMSGSTRSSSTPPTAATRLTGELGVDPVRVHVIPHGAFAHLADCPPQPPPFETDKPVVLCFGLMRPYKGIDLLLEAWREIDEAELWIAGMPKFDISHLRRAAPANVRFVPRFIDDTELPTYFQRADLVVLPYREIDQSGVLVHRARVRQAAAAERRRRLPRGGGDRRRAHVSRGRRPRSALPHCGSCCPTPPPSPAMAERARAAAAGPYSWDEIARQTLELYGSLASPEKSIPSRP